MSSSCRLKRSFQQVTEKIVSNVNPAPVVDSLFQNAVFTAADYDELTEQYSGRANKMRRIMALLHNSDNPRAFVILREALMKDYDYIVKEVDELCSQEGILRNY